MDEVVKVFKLNNINSIVFKKESDSNYFFTTKDSFMIRQDNFSFLLKYMLFKGIISRRLLSGILEEYDNVGRY